MIEQHPAADQSDGVGPRPLLEQPDGAARVAQNDGFGKSPPCRPGQRPGPGELGGAEQPEDERDGDRRQGGERQDYPHRSTMNHRIHAAGGCGGDG